MALSSFRSYQLALALHRSLEALALPGYLRSQLDRASSSVCLNLAEGSGKDSVADRRRSYRIAMGSLRELQAILEVARGVDPALVRAADQLGASMWRLIHPRAE